MTPSTAHSPAFSHEVSARFARQARHYAQQAHLQQGVAWRLAHLCRTLPLPAGPRADLGAGTGLVGQALRRQGDHQPLNRFGLTVFADRAIARQAAGSDRRQIAQPNDAVVAALNHQLL